VGNERLNGPKNSEEKAPMNPFVGKKKYFLTLLT